MLGLLMGGVIMSNASWRWCLLVIAPIAIIAALIALRGIRESKSARKGSYDIPGAVTVTLGLVILVYGLSQAEINGWGSPFILACIGIAIMLLIAFVLIERRSSHPLLPLRVVMDRNRAAALVTSLLMGASIYGLFLFLTYYLQGSLNYSPLMTGLAFVPLSAMIFLSASFSGRLLRFVSTRLAMMIGLLLAALGILWLTRISVHSGYPMLLVAELVIGLGLGFVFVTINSIGLFGVKPSDAGAASALMNATEQIGGAIGLAVLNTVAVVATNSYLSQESRVSDHVAAANIYGYSVSFGVITLFVVIALVVIILGVRMNEQTASTES